MKAKLPFYTTTMGLWAQTILVAASYISVGSAFINLTARASNEDITTEAWIDPATLSSNDVAVVTTTMTVTSLNSLSALVTTTNTSTTNLLPAAPDDYDGGYDKETGSACDVAASASETMVTWAIDKITTCYILDPMVSAAQLLTVTAADTATEAFSLLDAPGSPQNGVPLSSELAGNSSSSYELYLSEFVASMATQVAPTRVLGVVASNVSIWTVGPARTRPVVTTTGQGQ
jgi:hypothetical protein